MWRLILSLPFSPMFTLSGGCGFESQKWPELAHSCKKSNTTSWKMVITNETRFQISSYSHGCLLTEASKVQFLQQTRHYHCSKWSSCVKPQQLYGMCELWVKLLVAVSVVSGTATGDPRGLWPTLALHQPKGSALVSDKKILCFVPFLTRYDF